MIYPQRAKSWWWCALKMLLCWSLVLLYSDRVDLSHFSRSFTLADLNCAMEANACNKDNPV